jgi:hypothetical protein
VPVCSNSLTQYSSAKSSVLNIIQTKECRKYGQNFIYVLKQLPFSQSLQLPSGIAWTFAVPNFTQIVEGLQRI